MTVRLRLALCSVILLSAGCPPKQVASAKVEAPFVPKPTESLRLVFIGDTGAVNAHTRALRAAVTRERKDAVVVLGDVVYPMMPQCPSGQLTTAARRELDAKVGALLRGLGAPAFIVLGNHDTDWGRANTPRQACLQSYAAEEPDIVFPGENYVVDWGVAMIAFVNTNRLTAANGKRVREAFASHQGWKIGAGHHVLKTYRDKAGEQIVARWLKRERLRPDLWANGHAHLMQYGVYYGIAALTSGTGAFPRERRSCPPACGPGEVWGASDPGYALVHVTPKTLRITFKNVSGKTLFSTELTRPAGAVKGP